MKHLTPAPSFDSFGLTEPLLRALSEMGYLQPTLIQARAVPVALSGRDVMGAAQTGTGKTAGFLLPVLQKLLPYANASMSPARHPVRALILAPTRELAGQIYASAIAYARYTDLRCALVFGGMDLAGQIVTLRRGCEILVATPGRFLDHLQQKNLTLGQVSFLVLDEADRMLDMGFLPDIQRVIAALPEQRQTLLFSATFSKEIQRLASGLLRNPLVIEVAPANTVAETVEQRLHLVADVYQKRAALVHLVAGFSQVIVFTNTKSEAHRLSSDLTRAGIRACAVHGDKSQQNRLAALDAFKSGEFPVMVATDVAARGLDVAELPAVVNYDLPRNPEDYIHRIGRTGRAGLNGLALSLMTPEDAPLLAEIEKLLGRSLSVTPLVFPKTPVRLPEREHPVPPQSAGPTFRRGPSPRERAGYSQDPFFFKPYDAAAQKKDPAPPSAQQRGLTSGPFQRASKSRPLAVLLGGKIPN